MLGTGSAVPVRESDRAWAATCVVNELNSLGKSAASMVLPHGDGEPARPASVGLAKTRVTISIRILFDVRVDKVTHLCLSSCGPTKRVSDGDDGLAWLGRCGRASVPIARR